MQQKRWSGRGGMALSALVLSFAAAPAAAQDFEGIMTARVRGMPGEMKTFAKGSKYRLEISSPGQGAIVIITDPVVGETYMVMPAQSMYMVMKQSDAERMIDSAVRKHVGDEGTMTALGRKETIAGRSCEVYRLREPKSVTDICLTTGLAFKLGAGFFGGPLQPGRQRDIPGWARELARKGAFPLKVADTTGAMIWEVVSLELKKVDASLFTPPAGFRRMEMPSFGRPPAR